MSAQDNQTDSTDVPEMAAGDLAAPGFQLFDSHEIRPDGATQPNRPRDMFTDVAQSINKGENTYRQTVLGQEPLPGHPTVSSTVDTGPVPAELPAWLADADAEERRELEELGVTIAPQFDEEAERDALVSRLMRVHHEHAQDVERYQDAEALEHQTITQRYDRLRAPARRQMVRLASFITHLVSTVTFPGKKKSRSVGWGSYGLRKERDKVELVNMLTVVDAVRKLAPSSVKLEVLTNAKVADAAVDIISRLVTEPGANQYTLSSVELGALTELRAQLRTAVAAVGKSDVATLMKIHGEEAIPGAVVTIGADKPWFEVEPPTNG